MKSVYSALSVLVLMGGCASQDNLWHKQGDHFQNWRVKSRPHAVSPSVVSHVRELCPPLATDPTKPDLDNCHEELTPEGHTHHEFASEGGYAGGLGPATIQAAGFVGGMYVLGSSLRPAQTNVNQSGGGANAESHATQSQSMKQSQGQHQNQQQWLKK